MQIGDTVLILPSYALKDMHLEKLAGIRAKVIDVVCRKNEVRGCWVKLPAPYQGESEWFIPYNSIVA